MTEPGGAAWRQTTFYPFAQASRYGRGPVLQTAIDSPTHKTAKFGDVPLLHATAVQGEDGTITVFAVNRDVTRPLRLSVDVPAPKVLEHLVLADADRHAANTAEHPERVTPRPHHAPELPPLSWNMIRLG
jgi:alpha-N-arabinofuranosidase